MTRKRLDPPELRDTSATHWGLLTMLAGLRRALDARGQDAAGQGPHAPKEPAKRSKRDRPRR
jgi:hypothetical protein